MCFNSLRAGELNLLVATDVVGRGIDVSTVSHIINYDIPLDCDDYVHRVGRTGRMGREGIAFTFVTASEGPQLTAIELNINRLLIRDSLEAVLASVDRIGSVTPSESVDPTGAIVDVSQARAKYEGETLSAIEQVALAASQSGGNGQAVPENKPKRRKLFPKRRRNNDRLAKLSGDQEPV